jgi:putative ABC transporter type IV
MFAPKDAVLRGSIMPLPRALIYALAGCLGELFFTGCTSLVRTQRLRPHTSLLMLPICALIQPLFEPLHQAIRGRVPLWGRAVIYGGGFHAVEYVTGRLLRRLAGRAPWDYARARWQLDGLIRIDYFPLWAGAGLATEWLHDLLTAQPVRTRRRERPL